MLLTILIKFGITIAIHLMVEFVVYAREHIIILEIDIPLRIFVILKNRNLKINSTYSKFENFQ